MTGSVPGFSMPAGTAPAERFAFSGVRSRRIFAYLIDIVIIFLIQAIGFVVATVLAIPTLGLTTFAYAPLAITPLISVLYSGLTVGSRRQATLGQRAMDLMLVREDGQPIDFLYGAVHALLFYLSITVLTPAILVICLLNRQKRLLHDLVLGVAVRRVTP